MPLTVELWDGLATEPVVEAQVLGVILPPTSRTDPRFQLLRWVDPWGDTVFNRGQCAALAAELSLVRDELGRESDDEARALSDVLTLAERASATPHLYLVFVGD